MLKKQKQLMVLPQEVVSNFEKTTNKQERNSYIRALRSAGWTLESISIAVGMTREAVRQITGRKGADVDISHLVIPETPVYEVPDKVARVYVEPDPKTLARLLELQPYAQQVRGKGKAFRKEAEEYTLLLHKAHAEQGVTLYRLAKRLGITHGAIRFRLARYGYKPTVNGKSKVYDSILETNRVSV